MTKHAFFASRRARVVNLFLPLSFVLASVCAQGQERAAAAGGNEASTVYLFSFFRENGADGLYLAYSRDGYKWEALNGDKSVLKPQVGTEKLMRDPCVYRGPDNRFHMVWTTGWREKGIGYASSGDLISWSEQRFLPVMEYEATTLNTWAPEVIYDEESKDHLIFWSSTIPGKHPETDNQSSQGPPAPGLNNRIYYVTTRDFKKLSPVRELYERGFNVIDASIVKDGRDYVMFLKDETAKPFKIQKSIRVALGRKASGPYGAPSPPITGDYWAEGPTALKIKDTWFVYYDKYVEKTYGLSVSKDLKVWEEVSARLSVPKGLKHGTAFQVSNEIFERLVRRYSANKSDRGGGR